jgi:hypothetical protein
VADLITLADAKEHLKIWDDDHNADVAVKVSQASGIVVEYLGTDADDTWTYATVPSSIQAAVMIALGYLYENRGDELKNDDAFWAAIGRYTLRRKALVFA